MALGNLKEEAESLKGQLVHLKDEVSDLKSRLLTESSHNQRLQDQVSQLEQSLSKKKTEESSADDHNISEYARLNGALTTALGLGRPWVKTFFSFRKTSTFSALGIQRTSYGSPASLSRIVLQDALILNAGDTISIQLNIVSGQNSTTTGSLYEDGSSYYTRFLGYSIVLL